MSAEYGRFTGGVINTLTKSGGNDFHASGRDTLTNDKWTALSRSKPRRALTRSTTSTRSPSAASS